MRRREASGTEQRLSLKTLTELIKASAGSVTKADYWWSVERINALTSAFGAVAWPITVLIVAFVFRRPLIAFLLK